jgi:hypothetical protein
MNSSIIIIADDDIELVPNLIRQGLFLLNKYGNNRLMLFWRV